MFPNITKNYLSHQTRYFESKKCTKFDFGQGSAPDPVGELTALPRSLAVFAEGRERDG